MIGIKEKVHLIRGLANENGITAYDIGKNTEISLTSARNVLEDDNITPRIKTLHIILEYLENTIVGVQKSTELKPTHTKGFIALVGHRADFNGLSIEEKLNKLHEESLLHSKQLEVISKTLNLLKLNQETIIEISKKEGN